MVGHNAALMLPTQQPLCCFSRTCYTPHNCGMTQVSTAQEIRDWLNQVIAEKGLSAAAWAKKAGVAASTVQRAIKPSYEFVTSSRTLAKLAEAAGAPPPTLTDVREAQLVPRFLPVRYRVQAGQWIETDTEEPFDACQPVAPDPRYSEFSQWLELVVGDSINTKIADGGYAHVVDAIEMGYAPRFGDYVVVERRRAGGLLRERTIKQIAFSADGHVELWPRSTNPKWNGPLILTDGARERDDIEIEVVGLVIGAYSAF